MGIHRFGANLMPAIPARHRAAAPCPPWCVHHDRTPTWLRHSEHAPGSPGATVLFRERIDHRGGVGVETMTFGRVPTRAGASDRAIPPSEGGVEVRDRFVHPRRGPGR